MSELADIPQLTGDEIRAFRRRFGLPQDALATLLGASVRTVQEWEAERSDRPQMLRLAFAALAADLRPWRAGSIYVNQQSDGLWAVEVMPTDLGRDIVDQVAARPFATREAAEAFMGVCMNANTLWDGNPYVSVVRFPLLARRTRS